MNYLLILTCVLVFVWIISIINRISKKSPTKKELTMPAVMPKPIVNKFRSGKAKCFDCERQMEHCYGGELFKLAQPSKCFDCEGKKQVR